MRKADQNLCIVLVGALLLGSLWSERFISVNAANNASKATRNRSQPPQASAAPSAASSYDVPISGSVLDSIGRRLTISGTVHLELAEPAPVPVPVPVPGPKLTGITDTFGNPVTGKPSGWILKVTGAGLPTTGVLRLQIAGRIATVASWKPTEIVFTVPPGPPQAVTATGPVEIYQQQNGAWSLVTKGLSFTIQPSTTVGTPQR